MKTLSLEITQDNLLDIEGVDITMTTLRRELEMQASLDHPNICKVVESFLDEDRSEISIIMELCTGGTLQARLNGKGPFSEAATASVTAQVLSAIAYCHRHGVVHRDIKLDNFVFEDERAEAEIKLIDFGLAFSAARHASQRESMGKSMGEQSPETAMHTRLGTASYMAPELLSVEGAGAGYDSSVDVWAIGICTYMLLSGANPFKRPGMSATEITKAITEDRVEFPRDSGWGEATGEARDFIRSLLRKDAKERLNSSDALQHPWIVKHLQLRRSTLAHPPGGLSSVAQALETFAEADDLRKLTLAVLSYAIPSARVDELRCLFSAMDTDGTGTLERGEFVGAMQQMAPNLGGGRAEQIFQAVDVGQTGEISYNEFLSATILSKTPTPSTDAAGGLLSSQHVQLAFSMLDRDADGYISKDDLLGQLGDRVDAGELDAMLRRYHATGRLNLEAFQRAMEGKEAVEKLQGGGARTKRGGKRRASSIIMLGATAVAKVVAALPSTLTQAPMQLKTRMTVSDRKSRRSRITSRVSSTSQGSEPLAETSIPPPKRLEALAKPAGLRLVDGPSSLAAMSSHSQKLSAVGGPSGASALEPLPPIAALPPPDRPIKSALALNVADAAARSVSRSSFQVGAPSFRISTGREDKEKDPRKSVMFEV